ncbi:TPA: hypothetical protein ENS27_03345 [bacterium]|nr:hypothetical protein [bacterium]
MLVIKGIYDGKEIKPLEKIPFDDKYDVIITFVDKQSENKEIAEQITLINALTGCSKGKNLTQKLLESRREDLELEEAKFGKR